MNRFRGIYTVPVTAFTPDGRIDETAYRRLLDFIVTQGTHGIIAPGGIGEFSVLSEDERRELIEISVDEVGGQVPVLAGVGGIGTSYVIRLVQHAQQAGADGFMLTNPYYTGWGEDELYEHFLAICRSTDLPCMLYNNPFTTRINVSVELLCRLADNTSNFRYVKDTTYDVTRVSQIISASEGKLIVFAGVDDMSLESFMMGAEGWVAGVSNVLPREAFELFELADNGRYDEARKLYVRLLPFMTRIEREAKGIQCLRVGLEMMGMPVGEGRRPALPLTREQRLEVRDYLEALGVPLLETV